MEAIINFLGGDRYQPSTASLASDPVMKILFVGGWCILGIACFIIGFSLLAKRKNTITLNPKAVVVFSAVFILLGVDFFLSSATIFIAIYRLKVAALIFSAFVVGTAAILSAAELFGVQLNFDPDKDQDEGV